MAANASTRYLGVIYCGGSNWNPRRRAYRMTGLADIGGGNVGRACAAGNDTIVTTDAGA